MVNSPRFPWFWLALVVLVLGGKLRAGEEDSAAELLRRIRAELPRRWNADYDREKAEITVRSEDAFVSVSMEERGFDPLLFGDRETKPYTFQLKVLPLMTPAEFRQRAEENERLRAEADALHLGWAEGLNEELILRDARRRPTPKHPPGLPESYWDKLDRYRQLKKDLRHLPRYYFQQASFDVTPNDWRPTDEKAAAKCQAVADRVQSLLTAYKEPARSGARYGSRASVDELLARIRAVLPSGWEATYEYTCGFDAGWQDSRIIIALKGDHDAILDIDLTVTALLPPDEYQRIAAENAPLRKKAEAVAATLEHQNIPLIHERFFVGKTSKQRALATLHRDLNNAIQPLPDFHFQDLSLAWKDTTDLDDHDFREIRKKVLALLTPY